MPDAPIPLVVLAPMAGGPSTVELAAAVCDAGGLGFLAAGYRTADDVQRDVAELRARTDAPFGVNVFVVEPAAVDDAALATYLDSIRPDAARLGVELGDPRADDDDFDAKVDVLVTARVPVVSFTFALPPREVVERLQAVGTQVWMTVTSTAEAAAALELGVDAIVAQGASAGGHRAAFVDDGGDGALDTDELVEQLVASVPAPVIAAGGIATAADVDRMRALGAAAVQVGTAFLLADEAGTNPLHRNAVASDAPTGWTRAFSGRTARGIVNDFMRHHPDAPVAYPQVHHATTPLRAAGRAAGDHDRVNLWAGTRHAAAEARPAAEIVRSLTPGA